MKPYITNKLLLTAMLIITTLFVVQGASHAESLFMKDGSIVEGKIVEENQSVIILKVQNGTKKTIKKDNLLRIIYNEDYRRLTRLAQYDGTILEGYIVDEETDKYTVRKQLTSKEEVIVMKKEVEFIERAKIERRNPMSSWASASLLYVMPDTKELKNYLDPGFGVLFNYTKNDLFDNNFDGGISLGCIYFPGKDAVEYAMMAPLLLNVKYRYVFLKDFSAAPSISAGYSFNYLYSGEPERSPYMVNGSFYTGKYNRTSKYAFEPYMMGGMEFSWNFSPEWYVSMGVHYTAIIEKSGNFYSTSFTTGCGMKI